MTIEEAITRFKHNAEYQRTHGDLHGCLEFRQLAEWLEELKAVKQIIVQHDSDRMSEDYWIPTSERQPEENGNYLAFYRSSDGTAALEFVMVDHCNAGGGWLHEESGKKSYKKVIAWMPLPEPYKAESEG